MALEIFVGRNTVDTAASGDLDWTSADSSTTPVAAFHCGSNATANDSSRNNAGLSFGMTDGTTSRCVSNVANNDQTVADASRGHNATQPVFSNNPGANFEEGAASHDSFISGGERVTMTNGFNAAYLWASMFFAGANVAVEEATLSATVDLPANVDPGFTWDLVIVTSSLDTSGFGSDGLTSIGFMTKSDDVQGCMMINNDNGAVASDVTMQVSNTYAGGDLTNGTGALVYGIDVQEGSGTSADVYPRIAGGESHLVQLLFIGFTDTSQAKIISWDTPTATGNDSVTGTGFIPLGLIDLIGYASSYDTATTSAAGSSAGVSVSTEDSQFCNSYSEEYLTGANTDSQSLSVDVAVAVPLDDGTSSATTSLRATHVSMDADGWTRNWTQRDSATARKCITLAIGTPSVMSSDTHSIGRGFGRGIGRGIG